MWLLTIEDEEGSSTYHRLSRACYTVGRASENDIVLAQFDVSRRHARLERDGDGWVLVDEGSRNLMYVNGFSVRRPKPVVEGDVMQLGAYRLTLSNGHQTGVLTPPPCAVVPARLRVIAGLSAGTEYVFQRNDFVTIGADDGCSVRILHDDVGPRHAVIRALPGNLYELRSENGLLFVNGRLVRGSRLLEGGDAINVGGVALLRYLEPSQALDLRFEGELRDHVPLPSFDEPEQHRAAPTAAPSSSAEPSPSEHRFEAVGPLLLPARGVEPASYRVLRATTMPQKRVPETVVAGGLGEVGTRLAAAETAPSGQGWRAGASVHLHGLPLEDGTEAERTTAELAAEHVITLAWPAPSASAVAAGAPADPAALAASNASPKGHDEAEPGQHGRPVSGNAARGAGRQRTRVVALVIGAGLCALGVGVMMGRREVRGDADATVRLPAASAFDAAATKPARDGADAEPIARVAAAEPQAPELPPSTAPRGNVAGASAGVGPRQRTTPAGGERSRLEARLRSGRASNAELERLLRLCQLEGDARGFAQAHEQAQRARTKTP